MEIREKIIGIIRAQVSDINDRLIESKLKFADCDLEPTDWQCKNEKRIECKVYQGQIDILEAMENMIEDLLMPRPMGAQV